MLMVADDDAFNVAVNVGVACVLYSGGMIFYLKFISYLNVIL